MNLLELCTVMRRGTFALSIFVVNSHPQPFGQARDIGVGKTAKANAVISMSFSHSLVIDVLNFSSYVFSHRKSLSNSYA